jgi:hypothetical protein
MLVIWSGSHVARLAELCQWAERLLGRPQNIRLGPAFEAASCVCTACILYIQKAS